MALTPVTILQRDVWDGVPKKQGEWIYLHKMKDGRELEASGVLWSHQFGWELRLTIAGEFNRSHVCRTQEEVLSTVEAWREALKAKEWA